MHNKFVVFRIKLFQTEIFALNINMSLNKSSICIRNQRYSKYGKFGRYVQRSIRMRKAEIIYRMYFLYTSTNWKIKINFYVNFMHIILKQDRFLTVLEKKGDHKTF